MEHVHRADLVSARALGVGVGLIALQVTWLIANRIATLIWSAPVGPSIGFATAMVVGIVVSVIAGRRFVSRLYDPQEQTDRHDPAGIAA